MADGAARFRQDSSGPALLRVPLRVDCLPVPAFHRLRGAFPDPSGSQSSTTSRPYNPGPAVTAPVWAPPRSLATTWGIIRYFLLLRVLRCFSSPGSPPCKKDSTHVLGCPIRISPDQWLFAPPRSFSQLITSFIASESQGIPRTLLSNFLEFLVFSFLVPARHGRAALSSR